MSRRKPAPLTQEERDLLIALDAAEKTITDLRQALAGARGPCCHAHRWPTTDRDHWYRDEDGREVQVRMNPPELNAQTVDEIVTDEIHLEQMDHNAYWMRINGVTFNFYARGKITLVCEPESAKEFIVPLDETCQGNGCR